METIIHKTKESFLNAMGSLLDRNKEEDLKHCRKGSELPRYDKVVIEMTPVQAALFSQLVYQNEVSILKPLAIQALNDAEKIKILNDAKL